MNKNVLIGLFIVLVVLMPFGLNILLSLDVSEKWGFPIVGSSVDWLYFWASYLGAAASFIMIVYTSMSLRQNRKQLDEIKRQWNEERRARLVFSLAHKNNLIVLKVSNVGKEPAYNIKLRFSDEFIESLFVKYIRELYTSFTDKSFTIGASESKYFYLSGTWSAGGTHSFEQPKELIDGAKFVEWLNSHLDMPIAISGTYNDKYFVDEVLRLKDYFFGSLIIKDDLANGINDIYKVLVESKNQYATIQKSLDAIATSIEKYQNDTSGIMDKTTDEEDDFLLI